ncbi:MAG: hypothetical protein HYZ47_02960 [Simkania negevensis]|nr:hypothetical protein [Simkania negevensis]
MARLLRHLSFFCVFLLALANSLQAADNKLLETPFQIPEGKERLIGYLHIDKDLPIDESTFLYVKFALEEFRQKKASLILLDLDTPGGEVFSAIKIAQLLHEIDAKDQIPVIAFIDNWAISAGAMLAYSCRFIAITKTSSMGAAEPVLLSSEGKMETASEKVNSALRSEFINLANLYHRNPLIAEAMVDKEMILVFRQGQIVRLEKEEEIETQDQIITRKGKLLTLNAEELWRYQVADLSIESSASPAITEQTIASDLPLFQHPFFQNLQAAPLLSYSDWKVDFFSFLKNPLISSLLFLGLIIGGYMELSHPGFGVPGVLALICLSFILLSSFALQTVGQLELILLGIGAALLLIEIFIIPGFGVTGILGILLILFSLFMLTTSSLGPIEWNGDWNFVTVAFIERIGYFVLTLFIASAVIAMLARYITPVFLRKGKIISDADQEGFVAASFNRQLIGKRGVVATELKPAGHIVIENIRYQALSDGGFVDKGESVEVIGGRGAYLIVIKNKN